MTPVSKTEWELRKVAHELKLKSDANDLDEEVLFAELWRAFVMGQVSIEEG